MKKLIFLPAILISMTCSGPAVIKDNEKKEVPFFWENATVYFLLTDRFFNGDTANDHSFNRKRDGAVLRSFLGGDLKGITIKIEEGYFNKLGINALWITPPVEQVHGYTDEGTGATYGYHGYWTRDWTNIDPNFGTWHDFAALVEAAHLKGIRVVLDVVLNHTGPVTAVDSQWPEEWVRTGPTCTYEDFESTVTCTLVENLPDIRTEFEGSVNLPDFLIEKWENEGRLKEEMMELDQFFNKTGYPRAPKYYIIKWLTDFVREYGIDGFRVDTAKHTEPDVWGVLYKEVFKAFREWKKNNPEEVLDDNDFYMVGEVYGYSITHGLNFPIGDTTLNFFDHGFKSLINFAFKSDASGTTEEIYHTYDSILRNELNGLSVLSYLSSHDDSEPFDRNRLLAFEAGTKLMLTPGGIQIYYGDETARPLHIEGAEGDANLRSMMNWDELTNNKFKNGYYVGDVFQHWSKLGTFRIMHPAVGAGKHQKISMKPYSFTRILNKNGYIDKVMVILDPDTAAVSVNGLFREGVEIKDYYSGQTAIVSNDQLLFESLDDVVLLGIDE